MTAKDKDYSDIPGTYVFDGDHSRRGYHLNMFCMSLNQPENRDAFRADPGAYLAKFPLDNDVIEAINKRDWLEMLRLGGNIYYTFKLAIFDSLSMQAVGGAMSGITEDEFRQMMVNGGRPIEGNRYSSEQK